MVFFSGVAAGKHVGRFQPGAEVPLCRNRVRMGSMWLNSLGLLTVGKANHSSPGHVGVQTASAAACAHLLRTACGGHVNSRTRSDSLARLTRS
jgi:hypothetical protein